MIADQLRKVLRARPFKPFTVHLADGRRMTMDHPELMSVSPGGKTAHFASGRESFERIDVVMITSISTGERRRKRNAG